MITIKDEQDILRMKVGSRSITGSIVLPNLRRELSLVLHDLQLELLDLFLTGDFLIIYFWCAFDGNSDSCLGSMVDVWWI